MTLHIEKLSPDRAREYVTVSMYAFFEANDPNNRTMFPDGPTEPLIQHLVEKLKKELNQKRNTFWFGCFDSAAGDEMVAVARWRLEDDKTFDEEDDKPAEERPGSNKEAVDEFFGRAEAKRRELMGKQQYWNLQVLATAKKHEGRGAAKLLLRWGIDQADQAGLPVFIEATRAGKPVYERFGCKTMDVIEYDWTRFGETRTSPIAVMLRQPVDKPNGHH